jgi:hypothetical protein
MQKLDFELKVFHPQNCVYSIVADIKRVRASSEVSDDSAASNSIGKEKFSVLINSWLEASENVLCALQVSNRRGVSLIT